MAPAPSESSPTRADTISARVHRRPMHRSRGSRDRAAHRPGARFAVPGTSSGRMPPASSRGGPAEVADDCFVVGRVKAVDGVASDRHGFHGDPYPWLAGSDEDMVDALVDELVGLSGCERVVRPQRGGAWVASACGPGG